MSSSKRRWQEPVIKSIDQCQPIFGDCRTGSTPTPGGAMQCNAGTGASESGACTKGNGAKASCLAGNGVK